VRIAGRALAMGSSAAHSSGEGVAGISPALLERALMFTHIFGPTQEAEIRKLALSLGERVASGASQVRGYLVMLAI